MRQVISAPSRIDGVAAPPGDKSISHRAALLNVMARGTAHISNFCAGDDRTSMLRCLNGLGARIERKFPCPTCRSDECFVIEGRGPDGLSEPTDVLDAGNSGTTLRLVAGLLATRPFFTVITGDSSLRGRPMDRIVRPLTEMGATLMGRRETSQAPLAIQGGDLQGIDYALPNASAQVKSCILIAGMCAEGVTTVRQPAASRDHTERMMRAMGADVEVDELTVSVRRSELSPLDIHVPCDISSAAFWLVAGCAHPNARITVREVGINPTRTGVLDVLQAMGANIKVDAIRDEAGEPSADLVAQSSKLEGIEISGDLIPRVIDELPVLALAACFAKGTTVIKDAQELRVKESDRIRATVQTLSKLGAKIEERPDGMVIEGGASLTGAECESYGDHRIAMTIGIAGLLAKGKVTIDGAESANASYPEFWSTLHQLIEQHSL